MEKQHLEQRLQRVLVQPPSQSSSPATSQQDSAAQKEQTKSPDRTQVRYWSAAQSCSLVRAGVARGSIRCCAARTANYALRHWLDVSADH